MVADPISNFGQIGGVTTPATIVRRPRKKKGPGLSPLDPDFIITDWPKILNQYRFNTIPPLTKEAIEKMKYAWFLYYKFFQNNRLTIRTLARSSEDIENLVVKAGDFTAMGEKISRLNKAEERYSGALDRGTPPEKAIKNILERDLKKLR